MFKRILVALDSGDTCYALFDKALALAQATGASLILFSALNAEEDASVPSAYALVGYPIGINDSAWNNYQQRYKAYEARELAKLRNFVKRAKTAGIQAEFAQTSGLPGQAICDRAKACRVDLVMVGSHRRLGIKELLLGSVSNYVMHHAPCSVMVVHNQSTTRLTTGISNSQTSNSQTSNLQASNLQKEIYHVDSR